MIRLLTELDEGQLRRLEPHLYHLVLSGPPRASTARAVTKLVEHDTAESPYALLIEPLEGVRPLALATALLVPRAAHVAVVWRSILARELARAADRLSRAAGGPRIVCCRSIEVALATARLALEGAAAVRVGSARASVSP